MRSKRGRTGVLLVQEPLRLDTGVGFRVYTVRVELAVGEGALLKIGQVAAEVGVSVDTLRYYERLGLLPRAARTSSGYRLYDRRVIERVDFIKRAQSVGFTLEEIRQMLSLETADPQTCGHVLGMIEAKLRELDRRYEEIKRLRRELSAYKSEYERAIVRQESCPVIEDFIHPRARHRRSTGEKGSHVSVRKSKCKR